MIYPILAVCVFICGFICGRAGKEVDAYRKSVRDLDAAYERQLREIEKIFRVIRGRKD